MARILGFDLPFLTESGFLILNVLFLFAVLTYLMFNPVRNFMAKRTERIKSDLDRAESEKKKVMEMKQEYEAKLAAIKKEADEILQNAHQNALIKEEQVISEARQEADRIRKRAQLDIEREQERVKDEIKQEIIEVASLMAGKFVVASMDEKTQEHLLQETIKEMGEMKWLN